MIPADEPGAHDPDPDRHREPAISRSAVEQPIDLGGRVVVRDADPQHAAGLEQAEPLDERLRVEVAVPGRDRLAAECLRRGPR